MPPKKQAAASVVKGGSVSDAPAEDFDGATFTLTIEAQAHNFTGDTTLVSIQSWHTFTNILCIPHRADQDCI
jgi:hypothetical protein